MSQYIPLTEFQEEESLQFVFEKNLRYKQSKTQGFQNFRLQLLKQRNFQTQAQSLSKNSNIQNIQNDQKIGKNTISNVVDNLKGSFWIKWMNQFKSNFAVLSGGMALVAIVLLVLAFLPNFSLNFPPKSSDKLVQEPVPNRTANQTTSSELSPESNPESNSNNPNNQDIAQSNNQNLPQIRFGYSPEASVDLANTEIENDTKNDIKFTPLKADNQHQVTALDTCDFALKYPKNIDNYPIKTVQTNIQNNNPDQGIELQPIGRLIITNNWSDSRLNQDVEIYNMEISCFELEQRESYILEKFENFESKLIQPEDLAQETNWYLTEGPMKNIMEFSRPVEEKGIFEKHLIFDYLDTFQQISYVEPIKVETISHNFDSLLDVGDFAFFGVSALASEEDQEKQEIIGIFPSQIQTQFKSITDNEITQATEYVNNFPSSFQANSIYKTSVLESCDLAIRYRFLKQAQDSLNNLQISQQGSDLIHLSGLKIPEKPIVRIKCADSLEDLQIPQEFRYKKFTEAGKPYFLEELSYQEMNDFETFTSFTSSKTKFDITQGAYTTDVGEVTNWMFTFQYNQRYYVVYIDLFDQLDSSTSQNQASYIIPDFDLQIDSLAPTLE